MTHVVRLQSESGQIYWQFEATDRAGLSRAALSATSFTVMPVRLAVASPNGGEQWDGMTTRTIRWTSNFNTGTVTLKYSTDGGATYPKTIASDEANDGAYDWEVPQINAENVRVRVDLQTQKITTDISDNDFKIRHHAPEVNIVYPNGGETWEANSVNKIVWTARDEYFGLASDPIAIHYSTDGGRTFPHTIATREVNDSTYVWKTPRDVNSPNVRIKVEALNIRDVTGYDINDEDMGILNPPPEVSGMPDTSLALGKALYFCLNP